MFFCSSYTFQSFPLSCENTVLGNGKILVILLAWILEAMLTLSLYWAVTWLTSQVREFSMKILSVLGCFHLSSFLSFCTTPDLGRWNKGAYGIFSSVWSFMDSPSRQRSAHGPGCVCRGRLVYRLGMERGNRCRMRTSASGTMFQKCGGYHSSPLSTPKDKKVLEISIDRSKSTTSPKKLGLIAWYLGRGTWAVTFWGVSPWHISSFGKVARNCLYLPLYCTPVHSFTW